jgi:hypothetical protein
MSVDAMELVRAFDIFMVSKIMFQNLNKLYERKFLKLLHQLIKNNNVIVSIICS